MSNFRIRSNAFSRNIDSNKMRSPRSRFPRLVSCAHFHYEMSIVDIPHDFKVYMSSIEDQNNEKPPINISNRHSVGPIGHNSAANPNLVSMISAPSEPIQSAENSIWFNLIVVSHKKQWIIYRNYEDFCYLDKFFHDCVFDRKFSRLEELQPLDESVLQEILATKTIFKPGSSEIVKKIRENLTKYLNRVQEICFMNSIICGPILNWFEVLLT